MLQDPSYKIKNTFVEFTVPEDNEVGHTRGRRTRSDVAHDNTGNKHHHSPLVVASKSPMGSPSLHPVDETSLAVAGELEAVPIEEAQFEMLEEAADVGGSFPSSSRFPELGEQSAAGAAAAEAGGMPAQSPGLGRDEPAYIVPTTPSPFLHSAFPPSHTVPPFGYGYGMPGMHDMSLPPSAFPTEGEDGEGGPYMQEMGFIPDMYDPSFAGQCGPDGTFLPYWAGVPVEGAGSFPGAEGAPGGPEDMLAGLAGQDASGQPQSKQDAFGNEGFAGTDNGRPGDADKLDKRQDGANQAAEAAPSSQPSEKKEKEGRRGKGRNREAREADKAEARQAAGGGDAGGNSEKARKEPKESSSEAIETPSVYTTVMLRNIPNKYTREMLIKQLKQDFDGLFDFMYLPIDFKNKCNVGYGFINFRTPEACDSFVKQFHGVDVRKCLPGLNSKKVVEVTPARVQGLLENVRRLRNSPVMNQLQDHPEWMPLLFNEKGLDEPFPMPDQPLPPVKPRGRAREGHKQDNS